MTPLSLIGYKMVKLRRLWDFNEKVTPEKLLIDLGIHSLSLLTKMQLLGIDKDILIIK